MYNSSVLERVNPVHTLIPRGDFMKIEIFGGADNTRGLIYLEFDESYLPEVLNIDAVAEALDVDPKDLYSRAEIDGWEETLNIDFSEVVDEPLD